MFVVVGWRCSIILSAGESSQLVLQLVSIGRTLSWLMRVRISHPRLVLNMKPCVFAVLLVELLASLNTLSHQDLFQFPAFISRSS